MKAKTLPHNHEAEAAILGGILLRGDAAIADVLEVVSPRDFYHPANEAIFRAMLSLSDARTPIDVITLEALLRSRDELKLTGGIESLNRLGDRYSSSFNIGHHAELVRRAARKRRLIVTCSEIASEGYDEHEDDDAWVDSAEQRVFASTERAADKTISTAEELCLETWQDIQEVMKGAPRRVLRYWSQHNTHLSCEPGDLVIIAARPSMGKTAFVLELVRRMSVRSQEEYLRNDYSRLLQPVYFISLEMGKKGLMDRIAAAEANVHFEAVRERTLGNESLDRVREGLTRIANANKFWVDHKGVLNMTEIRARARRFRKSKTLFPDDGDRRRIGAIVVDYLQLVSGDDSRSREREQEVAGFSRGLKRLAMELEMPVFVLAQLNRKCEERPDKRPRLSDLRESGAIEQDADTILFIYRDEVYAETEAKKAEARNRAEIIRAKQRNGAIGTTHMHFFKETQRWADAA